MSELSLTKSFEYLQLSENSDINTVKKRYHQLSQKYHPDALPIENEEEKSYAVERFQLVTDAYHNIINYINGDNQSSENNDAPNTINKVYAKGIWYYKSGDINTALEFFLKAQKIDRDNPQYIRAIIRCLITKPRRLLEAKEYGMGLLKSDPYNPENQYLMGRIYQNAGFPDPAKSFYNKAIQMGYDEKIVSRNLQEITASQKKKGVFGKLFRKNQ